MAIAVDWGVKKQIKHNKPVKFEDGTVNGLGGDAFTRKIMI